MRLKFLHPGQRTAAQVGPSDQLDKAHTDTQDSVAFPEIAATEEYIFRRMAA